MKTTENTHLVFLTSDGEEEIVSIADILDSGYPIDPETGDDLELKSNQIVDFEGDPI